MEVINTKFKIVVTSTKGREKNEIEEGIQRTLIVSVTF